MPYLNDLLSQYECLLAICRFVSSADIIHLAATCKENKTSITGSDLTYNRLKKNAVCDGKGIIAQKRVFGLHGRDHKVQQSEPDWQCLGVHSKPCSDCGAQVCDVRANIQC
jgi:hypothetical protein